MSSLGTMTAHLSLDYSALVNGLRSARGGMESWKQHATQINRQTATATSSSLFGAITMGNLAASVLGRVASVAASIPATGLKLAADAEQTEIAFEVMLGSAQKAKQILGGLKEYADKSPFSGMQVNKFAQQLANYNIQAQDILPTIKQLGDIAAGDEDKFQSLATAFGQVVALGNLRGGEKNQFINAGFNPLQEISRTTGESGASLAKRMEDGKVSVQEVANALKTATSEGGRFFQMTERQAGTLAGKFSTLKDAVGTSLRKLGESLITNLDLKGWLDYTTSMVSRFPSIFANAGNLIQIEMLTWQGYFLELSPAFSEMMADIGIIFGAGWSAMGKNAHLFFQSVIAGAKEVKNLIGATGAGQKASANDPRHPSQWLRTGMNWLDDKVGQPKSLGYTADNLFGKSQQQVPIDSKGRPLSFREGRNRAVNRELAGQTDAMKPGTDWATNFLKDYKAGIAEAVAKPNGGLPQTDALKNRIAELRKNMAAPANLGAPVELGGALGDSFKTPPAAEAEKKKGTDSASNSAALRNSEAAASIFTRGLGREKELDTLKQIAKNTAANKNPFQPPDLDKPALNLDLNWGVANF